VGSISGKRSRSADAIEQRCEQPTPLGRVILERPDPSDVGEHLFRLIEPRVERRSRPQLFFQRLPAEHVFAPGEVAIT